MVAQGRSHAAFSTLHGLVARGDNRSSALGVPIEACEKYGNCEGWALPECALAAPAAASVELEPVMDEIEPELGRDLRL